MIPVTISVDEYNVRNLGADDMSEVLECINQEEQNCRTLGLEDYLSYDELQQRYLESLMNSLEYFCGIFVEKRLIGIIKGRIENKQENELWILSYLFLKEFRSKGIGALILKAVETYFHRNCAVRRFGILILNDNERGLKFWIDNGYSISRKTNSLGNEKQGAEMIILEKSYK